MPKKIDEELKARAVRLVQDHQGEYSASFQQAAEPLGVVDAHPAHGVFDLMGACRDFADDAHRHQAHSCA